MEVINFADTPSLVGQYMSELRDVNVQKDMLRFRRNLEQARAGKTVEEVMKSAAGVLRRSDVMEGVADMIDLLQVEAVFTDGSRLVSIHHPIK